MPKLPDKTALGAMPGLEQRPVVQAPTPDVASGFKAVQAGLGAVAGIGAEIQKKQDAIDESEVQKRFLEFDIGQQKALEEAKRSAPPGADGFSTGYRSSYDSAAREFMKGVPDRYKPKLDEMLVKRATHYEGQAHRFEVAERDRKEVQDVSGFLNERVTESMSNPDTFEDNAARGAARIDGSKLSARAKVETRRKFLDMNAEFAIRAMIDRAVQNNEDTAPLIEKLRRVKRGTLSSQMPPSSLSGGPRFSPDVDGAIVAAAKEYGVDENMLRVFVKIESGGDPRNKTGSYKGALQLSDSEFRKHGGSGDIYDPRENIRVGALKLKAEAADFEKQHGRQPTPSELYMVHQQGAGGTAAHLARPDAPAWQNMASTAEGRQKGPMWAKRAIWGNIPDADKRRFGSVENVTSSDFMKLWDAKVRRFAGESSAPDDGAGTSGAPPKGTANAQTLPDVAAARDNPEASAPPETDPSTGLPVPKGIEATESDIPKGNPKAESPTASRDDLYEDDEGAFDGMLPKTRRKLINYAREAGRARATQLVDADVEDIKRGKPPRDYGGRTALDIARQHMTNMQFAKAKEKWDAAKLEYDAVSPLRGMTEVEAANHIAGIYDRVGDRPEMQRAAAAAQKKADQAFSKMQAMRQKDPVRAVNGSFGDEKDDRSPPLPNVAAAVRKIMAADRPDVVIGPSGERIELPRSSPAMSPMEKWDLLFDARLKDQQRIMPDVPDEHRILSRQEARAILSMPSDGKDLSPKEYRDRLTKAAERATAMFGPKWARRAIKDAIHFQLRDKENENTRNAVLRRIAFGENPDPNEMDRAAMLDRLASSSLANQFERAARGAIDPRPSADMARYFGDPGRSQRMAAPPVSGRPMIGGGQAARGAQSSGTNEQWMRDNPTPRAPQPRPQAQPSLFDRALGIFGSK